MVDIGSLWEYQQLDMEVDRLEGELKSSEERKKALYYKNIFYKAQEEMQTIENGADLLTEDMNALEKDIEGLSGDFAFEIENDEDLELAKKCAADMSRKINRLSGALKELTDKSASMEEKMQKLAHKAAKAKKEYNEYKVLFDAKNKEYAPNIKAAKETRDKFGKKLDKALLERYNAIKSSRGMPISLLENSKCTGCNMSLPSVICSRVREAKELIECENCGKILYAK